MSGSRRPNRFRFGPWITEIFSVPVGEICMTFSRSLWPLRPGVLRRRDVFVTFDDQVGYPVDDRVRPSAAIAVQTSIPVVQAKTGAIRAGGAGEQGDKRG